LSTCGNIQIFNSANQIKFALQKIKGKLFFWISAHDTAAITTISRTNTPIIEELKAIKESNIKDSVIVIDNV